MVLLTFFSLFFGPSLAAVEVPSQDYADAVSPIWARMGSEESDHFELWTEDRDAILRGYGLSALEKAYERLGGIFGVYPKEKIRVEIYRSKEDFSAASTLSSETLERSGAIGICKFKRLMILTPEQLAFGYRWMDTLAHEYIHYLINEVSRGNCPLWLHEGAAKYHETLWRLETPDYLSPGNRTELAQAVKAGKLIPFSRMEPSMVYLKDQDEVRLAFSEVASALHFIGSLKGKSAIRRILEEMGKGESKEKAFEKVLELDTKVFEEAWKDFMKKEDLPESPGAAPDKLRLVNDSTRRGMGSEIEDLASVNIRGHIRLGDRLRAGGKAEASILQYKRALEKEPNNPVALTKLARALLSLQKNEEAGTFLDTAVRENPNYSPGFLLLGYLLEESDPRRAGSLYEEANALNPFDPEVHAGLAKVYEKLGDADRAKKEKGIQEKLMSP